MCGICGFVGNKDENLLKRMLGVLSHRGPDDEGIYFGRCKRPGANGKAVGLGHKRLSIIDLSLAGHQPMSNEDGNIWITYNGEIYNFHELGERLKVKGHRFKSKSDTEVIIHAYEEWNEDCVNKLRGMFTFALWDANNEKLFLVRDRVGIKPLYYSQFQDKFFFASEIKSLLQYEGFERSIDYQGLFYFLAFLYIPAPLTIFKNIKKLPAGHMLIYENGNIEIKKYWDLAKKKSEAPLKGLWPNGASRHEMPDVRYVKTKAYELMKETVESHLISDVPLGVFSSGGMDSSTVVGLMSKLSSKPVKTFSIGYGKEAESYNELEYARILAKHFKTDHYEFILDPDIMEILPKVVWHLDEPFADSSAILTYLISEAAKRHVTVALTGIGGDEVFGGYPRYIGAILAEYYARIPFQIKKKGSRWVEYLPESSKSRNIPGWIKRFIRAGPLPEDLRYISWISFLNPSKKEAIFTQDFLSGLDSFDPLRLHQNYYNTLETDNELKKIFYLDTKTYLPDDLLMMGDKMGMANSLEIRVPFCDHEVVEFAFSIPTELKFKGFKLKALMKQAFSELLPPQIIHREKRGFMVPISQWFKKELKPFTLKLLSEENVRKRNILRYDYVKWVLDRHFSGKQNLSDQIWAILTLEIWYRIYIDNSGYKT